MRVIVVGSVKSQLLNSLISFEFYVLCHTRRYSLDKVSGIHGISRMMESIGDTTMSLNPFRAFQVLAVLEDGTTFSGAEGATLQVFPNDEHCTEDQMLAFENGEIPETGDLATIDLKQLLKEAIAAGLPSVKDLASRL